jgi:hypothetical protein
MKQVLGVMTSAFRCRVIVNYVINAPKSITFMWTMAKGMLDAQTKKKIQILKGPPEGMLEHFNPL